MSLASDPKLDRRVEIGSFADTLRARSNSILDIGFKVKTSAPAVTRARNAEVISLDKELSKLPRPQTCGRQGRRDGRETHGEDVEINGRVGRSSRNGWTSAK